MSDLKEEIRVLQVRKARQFSEIEMLTEVNESVYTRFGKTAAELMLKEKLLIREGNTDLDENH